MYVAFLPHMYFDIRALFEIGSGSAWFAHHCWIYVVRGSPWLAYRIFEWKAEKLLNTIKLTLVAIVVVELDVVHAGRVTPQVQIAIGLVVSIGFAVHSASKPPTRTICCPPCGLLWLWRPHGVFGATATSILRTGDVHDEVRRAQRPCRVKERLPIPTAAGWENFEAWWTTAFLGGLRNWEALLAFDKNAWRIPSGKLDLGAPAGFGTSPPGWKVEWLCLRNFARAQERDLPV